LNLEIYGIGGDLPAPDNLFGTATDIRTAMSLVHLARITRCRWVIFHGDDGQGKVPVYEMSTTEAQIWLSRLALMSPQGDLTKQHKEFA
jgi:hypothetical protein